MWHPSAISQLISVKWAEIMGNVFSGNRTSRDGKLSTSELPEARLTYRRLDRLEPTAGPYIRIEGNDWATVVFGTMQWPVLLEWTPVNLGGTRRWLICSKCSSRRQALYVKGNTLACRGCLKLRFDSQHENNRSRMIRRLAKLRAKLGWQPGPLSPFGSKPKGMHRQTYANLRRQVDTLTQTLFVDVRKWVNKVENILDTRR